MVEGQRKETNRVQACGSGKSVQAGEEAYRDKVRQRTQVKFSRLDDASPAANAESMVAAAEGLLERKYSNYRQELRRVRRDEKQYTMGQEDLA
jgi:hypothetical protein